MPIHIRWDNDDKAILMVESAGRWTWEEYHEALDQMVKMIQSVNHRVDIINARGADSIQPSGSGLPHYQRALRVLPSNTGKHVLINTSMMARTIVSLFLRMSRSSEMIVLAGSMDEARELIAKDRAKSI